MTYANNLDPDEAPQNLGLHLRSKLFDIQIIYRHKKIGWKQRFFANFERKINRKNYPACKELKSMALWNALAEFATKWKLRSKELFYKLCDYDTY